jgi:fumarate reductase flavoprotein subunit
LPRAARAWPKARAHPDVFAAGGAARCVSGNAVWGYRSGNGLLSAVAGAFIAAGSIARQLSEAGVAA